MEKINITNYPVWITDYFDGTLPGDRVEELFAFLSEHPDLMEEFEQYDYAPLHPSLSVRSLRKNLTRGFGDLALSQQEELIAALAEGDITGEEAEEILSYIDGSPHLAGLYRSLKDIRLVPDHIPFPEKKSLKRYPPVPRFHKAVVTLLTAAASIAILFSFSILLNRDKPLSVPLTGSAQIDPVIIIERERSNSRSTAENVASKPEEAESSENSNEVKSLSSFNTTSENDTSAGRTAENDTSAGRTADEGNRRAATADVSTYGQAITGNDTSDRLPVRQKITAGITEEKELQGNGIEAAAREENRSESDNRRDNEQPKGNYNLSLIREHSTPSIKEGPSAAAQLAEMVPIEVTENDYSGSPREFIAKNFRKLAFNDQNASSDRLKPIELAEATVTGINKLLGWEMKLEKKNDDNGTMNSISFASQLVKFDHNLKTSGN
ncbi:MAG: hypothetical protein ABR519_11930 [Bacteroidales bacterium]